MPHLCIWESHPCIHSSRSIVFRYPLAYRKGARLTQTLMTILKMKLTSLCMARRWEYKKALGQQLDGCTFSIGCSRWVRTFYCRRILRSLTGTFFLGATAGGGSHENTAFKRTTRKAAVRDAAPRGNLQRDGRTDAAAGAMVQVLLSGPF